MAKKLSGKRTISVILSEDTYESVRSWADSKEWSVSKTASKLIESGLIVETQTEKAKRVT
jgi:hypothetical protein